MPICRWEARLLHEILYAWQTWMSLREASEALLERHRSRLCFRILEAALRGWATCVRKQRAGELRSSCAQAMTALLAAVLRCWAAVALGVKDSEQKLVMGCFNAWRRSAATDRLLRQQVLRCYAAPTAQYSMGFSPFDGSRCRMHKLSYIRVLSSPAMPTFAVQRARFVERIC